MFLKRLFHLELRLCFANFLKKFEVVPLGKFGTWEKMIRQKA
jgi:hypothetical protein